MVWVKRLGVALVALLVVAGISVAALLALVDPNDYKPMLQQTVQQRYDRTLAIDGDIRLSVLPRLGLEISGVSLSEPGSTQTFAAMDTARVAVAWWPLLSRHLVIEHLSVTGLKANLVRTESGRFNFQDLLASAPAAMAGATPPPDPASPAPEPGLSWNIAGVSIEGGELAVSDVASGMALRIERVAAQARGIALGQPFDVSLGGRILGQTPRADAALQAQARVTLQSQRQQVAIQGLDIRLDGVLPSVKATALNLKANLLADLAQSRLQATDLSVVLQGDVAMAPPLQGLDLQVSVPALDYAWDGTAVVLQRLALKAQGRLDGQAVQAQLEAPRLVWGTGQASEPVQLRLQRSGERALELQLALEGLVADARGVQVGRVQSQGQATLPPQRQWHWQLATPLRWLQAEQRLTLAGLEGHLRLAGPGAPGSGLTWPLTASLEMSLAEQRLVGTGEVRQADQALAWRVRGQTLATAPSWTVQLTSPAIDVARWWPAPPAAATAGAPTVAPGPGTDARAAAEPLWNPDWLAGPAVALDVQIGQLRFRDVLAESVRVALQVANGRADLKQLQARLLQGTVLASGHATASQALALQLQMRNLAVQPLLQAVAGTDRLAGRGNLDLDLTSQGVTQAELRQALAGQASLFIRDGAVRGINVAQSLREVGSVLGARQDTTQAADATRQTDFTELRADLAVAQGVATVHNLVLAAPLIRATQGSPAQINLVNDTYDLVVQATVVNTATGQDGKALEQLRGVTVPIHLTGPLADPQYAIRWSAVGGQALQQVLQNEAERQLGRLLERQEGSGAGTSPGRALGDALKGLLGR